MLIVDNIQIDNKFKFECEYIFALYIYICVSYSFRLIHNMIISLMLRWSLNQAVASTKRDPVTQITE